MYSRVYPHPPRPVFNDEVYLDGAGLAVEHAVYRDGLTGMDELVPHGDEIRCIGGRVGVLAEKLVVHAST